MMVYDAPRGIVDSITRVFIGIARRRRDNASFIDLLRASSRCEGDITSDGSRMTACIETCREVYITERADVLPSIYIYAPSEFIYE